MKLILSIFLALVSVTSFAARKNSTPVPQDVSTEKVKERYWNQGSEDNLGVVQNRLYTKESKIEFQPLAGLMSSDPFLDVYGFGGLLGYHFSESLSFNAIGWKYSVSDSEALERLKTDITTGAATTANLNKPNWFLGAEIQWSPIYGKLSLLGKAILYYDFHLLGGSGLSGTQNGKYLTPFLGIGQQVYITQWAAIRLDYRHMYYREEIIERVRPSQYGNVIGKRTTWTRSLTLGMSFLF